MRLTYFGGPAWEAGALPVRGRGQEALLCRLALDTGTVVSYRSLAEDVWPDDQPGDTRAALQSLASRVRKALPGVLEAVSGGYRLMLERDEVDLTRFADLVARARGDGDAELARDALALWTGDPWLPEGFDWALRDLLEDRAHAERIVAGLPRGSSAASVLPTHVSAVPAAIASLVGRGPELDTIIAQLAESRVVTILGPGGAGKTTLALETARRHAGAVVVELAPATPDEVWSAIAGAVGRTVRTGESTVRLDPSQRAVEALAGRDVLMVFDNCEHVSAAAADAAVQLLRDVPGLRIVATSREPLGIAGEAFVPLGSLPDADAIELFARRVRAASGTAPTAAEDLAAAARIVARLDGLPLAIELAAAKTRTLTLAEIESGLDDRFALLASGPRTADPRHQTLRALIDWSWEMLSTPERTALRGAAVFPDGILARDATTVAEHLGTDADAFDRLVDRSLLHRAAGRFRMLETVREYGVDLLRTSGDDTTVRLQAADAIGDLALAADPLLRGPRVREAIAWYDANEENLSAALRIAEASGDRVVGTRVLRGALWAWAMRERFPSLSAGLEVFAGDDAPLDGEPAVVVCGLGLLLSMFVQTAGGGRLDPADEARFRERAGQLAAAVRSYPSELSLVLPPLLGAVGHALDAPDHRASRMWGLRLEDVDDPDAPAWTRALLAVLRTAFAQNSGEVDALGVESAQALAGFLELGDAWGTALASQMRAEWLTLHGRLDEALAVADAAHAQLVGLTSTSDILQQQATSVGILARLGRFDEAGERMTDIERSAREDGSARAMLQFRFTAATLAIAEGDADGALAHLEAPEAILPSGGPEDQFRAWIDIKRAQALLLVGGPAALETARQALRVAVPTARGTGDQPIISEAVLTFAAWLAATGDSDAARRAFGQAVRLRGHTDDTEPTYRRVVALLGEPPVAAPDSDDEVDALAALLG